MKVRERIFKFVFNRKSKSESVMAFDDEPRISYIFLWVLVLALMTSLMFFYVGTKMIFG